MLVVVVEYNVGEHVVVEYAVVVVHVNVKYVVVDVCFFLQQI